MNMKKKSYKQQLGLLQHKKQFFVILIFLFVVVIIWTVISLASSQEKLQISKELKDMTIPLNPNIDIEVFDKLNQKRQFSDNDLRAFSIYKIISSDRGTESRVVKIDYEEDLETEETVEEESPLGELEEESTPEATKPAEVEM